MAFRHEKVSISYKGWEALLGRKKRGRVCMLQAERQLLIDHRQVPALQINFWMTE